MAGRVKPPLAARSMVDISIIGRQNKTANSDGEINESQDRSIPATKGCINIMYSYVCIRQRKIRR